MKEDPKTRLALERNESKEGCRGAGFLMGRHEPSMGGYGGATSR